jgi:hypothetical protein
MAEIKSKPYDRPDYIDALQKMLNRMAVSQHKYGSLEDNYPYPVDALKNADARIQMYLETGNTEFLLDAANFMVIEHLRPRHGRAHFQATDSDASPGLI